MLSLAPDSSEGPFLRLIHTAFLAALTLPVAAPANAQKITVYDVPGSTRTFLTGINDSETVVGYYTDSASMTHGFVISQGKLAVFDAPGATGGTYPSCINASGVIAGTYQHTIPSISAFVRSVDGTIAAFDVPGNWVTQVTAINASGAVTGYGVGNCPANDGSQCAFIRDPQGNITNFGPPDNLFTYGWGFGPGGIVLGNYVNSSTGIESALVRKQDGTLQTFAFPNETNTALIGMTPSGLAAGFYGNQNDTMLGHGFLMNLTGKVLSFDVPDSTSTIPVAINSSGVVIGTYYSDSSGQPRGFIRGPKGGFLTIEPPNNTSVSPAAINGKRQANPS